jgi:Icc-related predicted phosphoesterase
LILGCGDLDYEYLEFLVTLMNVPLLYVPGNHDPAYVAGNRLSYAEGCEMLDLRFKRILGLNIAGIGGSIRYRPHAPNQYTQSEMYFRLASFLPRLMWKLFRNGRKLDIVIAHSPPCGIHDDVDPAHVGFSAFNQFIRLVKPRYFLHGHTLSYQHNVVPPLTQVRATTVININPYRIFEV